jgi:hypothetical protein
MRISRVSPVSTTLTVPARRSRVARQAFSRSAIAAGGQANTRTRSPAPVIA